MNPRWPTPPPKQPLRAETPTPPGWSGVPLCFWPKCLKVGGTPPPPPHANSAHPRRGSKQTTGTWRNRLLNESHFIGLVPAAHTLSGIVMSWSELGCSIITAIHHSHYSIQLHQIVMWGQAPVSRRRTPVWPVGAVFLKLFLNFEEIKTQYVSILVWNKYKNVIIMRHCNRKLNKTKKLSL